MSRRSTRSPPPVVKAAPADDTALPRQYIEDRYELMQILHNARDNVMRFDQKWKPEAVKHDKLLNEVVFLLKHVLPVINREGRVMLNAYARDSNKRANFYGQGEWFDYAPELLIAAREEARPVPEHQYLASIDPTSPPVFYKEPELPEPAAELTPAPIPEQPSSKVLGKRRQRDEDEDAADQGSPPPSPLKKQRQARSSTPSPSPGLSNYLSNSGVSSRSASSPVAAPPAPSPSRAGPSSPRKSPSRRSLSPRSSTSAGSSGRGSRSPSPRRETIADHTTHPPSTSDDPFAIRREEAILVADIGNGGEEVFPYREGRMRQAEYQDRMNQAAQEVPPVVPPVTDPHPAASFRNGPTFHQLVDFARNLDPLNNIQLPLGPGGQPTLYTFTTYHRRSPADMRQAVERNRQREQAATTTAPAALTSSTPPTAGPSRSPKKKGPKKTTTKTAKREAAAGSAQKRAAKRRSPTPPVAGPSNSAQPLRRSTRNKGTSS